MYRGGTAPSKSLDAERGYRRPSVSRISNLSDLNVALSFNRHGYEDPQFSMKKEDIFGEVDAESNSPDYDSSWKCPIQMKAQYDEHHNNYNRPKSSSGKKNNLRNKQRSGKNKNFGSSSFASLHSSPSNNSPERKLYKTPISPVSAQKQKRQGSSSVYFSKEKVDSSSPKNKSTSKARSPVNLLKEASVRSKNHSKKKSMRIYSARVRSNKKKHVRARNVSSEPLL